eukprot:6470589-Amphidinium_carterae.2
MDASPCSAVPALPEAPTTVEVDEYSVLVQDLICLRLDLVSPSSPTATSVPCATPVYVIRLSTHQQCSEARGLSQLYKVDYDAEHTIMHLAQGLASKLKLH